VCYTGFLSAQERIKIFGNPAYGVFISAFENGRFELILDSDTLGETRIIPYGSIEAWYSNNKDLLYNVKNQNTDLYAKLVDSAVAARWIVPPVVAKRYKDAKTLLGILPLKNNEVMFERVYNVPEVDKKEIYLRSMLWLTDVYNNTDEVVKFTSPENGIIVGKGSAKIIWSSFLSRQNSTVECRILIKVKDGKALLNISGFICSGYIPATQSSGGNFWIQDLKSLAEKQSGGAMKKYLTAINDVINSSMASFELYLKTNPNDW